MRDPSPCARQDKPVILTEYAGPPRTDGSCRVALMVTSSEPSATLGLTTIANDLFAGRVNDDHHAPIRLLAHNLGLLHRRIHHRPWRHQKLRRAVTARLNLFRINPHHAHQIILHAIGAALA